MIARTRPFARPASTGRTRAFTALTTVALAVSLVFLTLPVVAVFANTAPGKLVSSLGDGSARDALGLSLETSTIALALILVFGTPAAYLLATRSFRGRSILVTLIELPLVL